MGDTHGVGKRQLFLSVEKGPVKESGFGLSVPVLLVCPARGGETGLECCLGGSGRSEKHKHEVAFDSRIGGISEGALAPGW